MAEALVTDLAAGLIRKLVSLLADEVIQAWNLDKDLETLRERFALIGALLNDANTKNIIMSTAQIWFNKLQEVANEVEVFLDELAYEVTRRKVENRVWNSFIPSKNTVIYRLKVAHKIKSIHASFDTIRGLARDIGLRPFEHINLIVQTRGIRITASFEDKSSIVGRDMDVSNLVQAVCKNSIEQDLHVVAIVGMGGQGKTTLARMVFNHDDVSKMFPKRMWITISDDFKLISILKEMVQSLTLTKPDLDNAQSLVNELQKSIKGEKFLLVLDDVWNEEQNKWNELRNCLLGVGGAKGSSVIVTTRNQEVIAAMHNCVPYPLGNLQEDISYILFRKIAFQDGGVSEIQPFVDLGRSMVKRCGGLPLAIKALAGLLQSKKFEQEWREIKNSEIWKSKGVLSSLRLSYDNLPYSSLKRCFAYCSIIPKDSVIYKDELIQIWMALGFLLPPVESGLLMEDIGKEYFNILSCHSLLQDIERDEFGNIESCKMHDLVHDLALDLSKHHSLTLRTGAELNHVLVLNKFSYGDAEKLPKSIQNLKYIKYLDISHLVYVEVPSYITELYNLQTLRVWTLKKLPKKFCNLINLRHLYIEDPYGTKCLLHGIERLTCLQTLSYFVVRRSQNCLIGQLEGLQNLGGKLGLYGLGDVANMEEASKAKLDRKPNIQSLLLNWSTDEDYMVNNSDEDEHVMEGLEPLSNLKELIIENFRGKRLASWITKMTNLVKIKLSNCERCEELPSLGHFPQLREMNIDGFHGCLGLTRLTVGVALEKLKVKGCPALTRIDAIEETCCLRDLTIDKCPSLSEIGQSVSSTIKSLEFDGCLGLLQLTVGVALKKLNVKGCPALTRIVAVEETCCLRDLTIEECPSLSEIDQSVSSTIKSLEFDICLGLTRLTVGVALEKLKVKRCPALTRIDAVEETCCLRDLFIWDCPSLSDIDQSVSSTIKSLQLLGCRGLTRLTVGVALEKLRVSGCRALTRIDAVEETCCLRKISIWNCPSLSDIDQSVSSTVEKLKLGGDATTFSSSIRQRSFLTPYYKEKATLEFDDHLISAFSTVTHLKIHGFKGMKALPDTIAKLPSLEYLSISGCRELESLPTFDQSHTIQRLIIGERCDILKKRCKKNTGPEWFKIQYIPIVEFY